MAITLEQTVHQSQNPRSMKFTFPPESRPLEGYTIKRAIHRGGFGEVYYALSDAGKEVALKLLQQNLEIELRGVTQCMNLKHPNLVTIFDVRTDADGDHWIIMEYVRGKSLDRVIDEQNGPLSMDEIERWLVGMAGGLSFLHDRGIVHRDLKPANIFQESGVVKIGDIGLAKFITQSKRSAQTESVGTVYYMAPEVARGRYGHEVDIYSLGVVMYEMLCGRVPFDGESTAEILMKHLSEKADLSPVPKRLRPVVANALQKDPLKRTSTVEQLLADFRKAVAGVEIPTTIPDSDILPPVNHQGRNQPATSAASEIVDWDDIPDKKWRKHVRQLDRKAERHERIEARKAARHARKEERRANRHARKMQRKAVKNGGKPGGESADVVAPPLPPPARGNDSEDFRKSPASRGKPHANKPTSNSAKSNRWSHWMKLAAISLIIMAVVMPRSFAGMMTGIFRGALLLGPLYLIYVLFFADRKNRPWSTGNSGRPSRSIPVKDKDRPTDHLKNHIADAECSPRPRQTYVPRNAGMPARSSRRSAWKMLRPETVRTAPLRARMIELAGSLTLALAATAVITAAVAVLSPVMQTPARITLFAAGTLFGSWAVLLTSKVYEGSKVGGGHRRLVTLLGGVLTGAVVCGLHHFLLIRFARDDYNLHGEGLVHTIGSLNLSQALQPTLAGYVLFFGLLFVVRHWWRHADSLRQRRFRITSVLLTTLLGLVTSLVFTFPIMWGVTWAAAISSVVQLSATWFSPDDRRRMTEAGHVA